MYWSFLLTVWIGLPLNLHPYFPVPGSGTRQTNGRRGPIEKGLKEGIYPPLSLAGCRTKARIAWYAGLIQALLQGDELEMTEPTNPSDILCSWSAVRNSNSDEERLDIEHLAMHVN